MASQSGGSAPPVQIFGPDPQPVHAPNSMGGVSAQPGWHSPGPPIDPVVAKVAAQVRATHGMGYT